jgi:hypothetical protein
MNEEWIQDGKFEEIKEYDLDRIPLSSVTHVIGSPGMGKTYLEQFLAYAYKHRYPVAQIFCGTENIQNAFTPIFGGSFVSATYTEHDHQRFMARQTICSKEGCNPVHSLQIIDDFGFDPKVCKSKAVTEAHKNGPQWLKALLIMGFQSIKDIPENIINSPSRVFIFMEKEDSNRRKIHRQYFKTIIPEYKDFSKLMNDVCSEKGRCLVVELNSTSSELSDCVFAFKAPGWRWSTDDPADPKKLHPYPEGWRFGCKQYKEWSDLRYDPNAIPDFISELNKF